MFFRRRCLERLVVDALRVGRADDMADDAAFAAGIHGLQDQQHAVAGAEPALREELLLQFRELFVLPVEQFLARIFVAGKPRGRSGVDMAQVEVLRGPQALFYGKSSPGGVIAAVSRGKAADTIVRMGALVGLLLYVIGLAL